MNFWQQIQAAAEMTSTLPWLFLGFIVALLILFALKPSERMRLRASLLLFGLSLVGLLIAATLLTYGIVPTASAYKWIRWSWRIFLSFALVNVAGILVFEVFLAALRVRPPRIMRDLPFDFSSGSPEVKTGARPSRSPGLQARTLALQS